MQTKIKIGEMTMDINHENVKQMESELSDSVLCNVARAVGYVSKISWRTVKFTINREPKPSQRPRLSGYRIYVPGAAKNTAFFSREVAPKLGGLWIDKPCKMKIDLFVHTPTSFTKTQKMLAEMKIIRPWTRCGDLDNFEKSIMDSIVGNKKRGHKGVMVDDCIVCDLESHKYYFKTPRTEVTITFMDKIPKELEKSMKLYKGV
jgi:Holliday junction resolvase RusA-like endonuclease